MLMICGGEPPILQYAIEEATGSVCVSGRAKEDSCSLEVIFRVNALDNTAGGAIATPCEEFSVVGEGRVTSQSYPVKPSSQMHAAAGSWLGQCPWPEHLIAQRG